MRNSSVKWGHMGNFDPTPTNTIFITNPMGSSGPLWARLSHFGLCSIFHNYYNLNCELMP